jgi:hypothetical protein
MRLRGETKTTQPVSDRFALYLRNEEFSKKIVRSRRTRGNDQNEVQLSHTITPRTHRRLCPFGVGVMTIERKLRVIHPRMTNIRRI